MQDVITIKSVQTELEFKTAKELILEYSQWLGFDLSFQNFEKEMETLTTTYGFPDGGIYVAYINETPTGVAGIKRFNENECELKRMFIKENGRGKGIGKLLLQECIDLAGKLNYTAIKLDTMNYMQRAIKLYVDFGFSEISAYRFNPNNDARYFELIIKK